MSLIIKIEKIKHRYEEYDLSFATYARGLPEKVPQNRSMRKISLDAVDEEVAMPKRTKANKS